MEFSRNGLLGIPHGNGLEDASKGITHRGLLKSVPDPSIVSEQGHFEELERANQIGDIGPGRSTGDGKSMNTRDVRYHDTAISVLRDSSARDDTHAAFD